MWIIYIDFNIITWQHFGIILTILGTYLLAISVKIKAQKGSGIRFMKKGNINVITSMPPDDDEDYVYPTETFVDRKLFKYGLLFVAIGSLLQW